MPEDPQSFFRRWRIIIPVGVLLLAVLVLVREFVNYRSNSPIVDPYLAVINDMSLHSLRARQRLDQYYAKYQRQTVASKHYPWLCKEMQELAAQDGFQLVWLPGGRSPACTTLFNIYERP